MGKPRGIHTRRPREQNGAPTVTQDLTLHGTAIKELLQERYSEATRNAAEAKRRADGASGLVTKEETRVGELAAAEKQATADLQQAEAEFRRLEAQLKQVQRERQTSQSIADRSRTDHAQFTDDYKRFTVDAEDAKKLMDASGVEPKQEQPHQEQPREAGPAAPFVPDPAGPTRHDGVNTAVYDAVRADLGHPVGPNSAVPPGPQ